MGQDPIRFFCHRLTVSFIEYTFLYDLFNIIILFINDLFLIILIRNI